MTKLLKKSGIALKHLLRLRRTRVLSEGVRCDDDCGCGEEECAALRDSHSVVVSEIQRME